MDQTYMEAFVMPRARVATGPICGSLDGVVLTAVSLTETHWVTSQVSQETCAPVVQDDLPPLESLPGYAAWAAWDGHVDT